MTAYTPNFQLPYLEVGQPVRDTRAVLEEHARKTDAALTRGPASPPAAQDLAAVAGRVAVLETPVAPIPVTVFTNGWAQQAVGAYKEPLIAYKDRNGMAHLLGIIASPNASTPGTTAAFSVPTSCLPPVGVTVARMAVAGGNVAVQGVQVRFDILETGVVNVLPGAALAARTFIPVDFTWRAR